jgi:hypothetical protein
MCGSFFIADELGTALVLVCIKSDIAFGGMFKGRIGFTLGRVWTHPLRVGAAFFWFGLHVL